MIIARDNVLKKASPYQLPPPPPPKPPPEPPPPLPPPLLRGAENMADDKSEVTELIEWVNP